MDKNHYGRVGYEAYAKSTGGKTFDGRDMPKYEELPQRIRDAWCDAGEAIAEAAGAGEYFCPGPHG